jgi:hypothetical protein
MAIISSQIFDRKNLLYEVFKINVGGNYMSLKTAVITTIFSDVFCLLLV